MAATTLKFKQRANGTGTVGTITTLAVDDGGSTLTADWASVADNQLKKIAVRAHYFPAPALSREAARLACTNWIETIKSALNWRVPQVRPLARGKVLVPNIYNNFGDLVYDAGSPNVVILDNCTLFDCQVEDDGLARGVTLILTFGRASDILAP